MGAFWLRRNELLSILSEHAGSKAGLALNSRKLRLQLPSYKRELSGNGEQLLRVRAEELAFMGAELLFTLGNTPSPQLIFWPPPHLIPLLRDDLATDQLHTSMREILEDLANNTSGPINLDVLFETMLQRHGKKGLEMALLWFDTIQQQQHQSIGSTFRRVEWADVAELKDLFESEELQTRYGHFLDQRFLDYLARNEHAIDSMNWRKFEGLAAEYFARNGYRTILSKGRNDNNVDLRVWNSGSQGAPLLLVQCKRQKEKVGKVVVKALYADLLHEKAHGGLIVTSSSLSPGAEKTCVARSYPITQANRQTLAQWLAAMQSPGAGVFMGT